MKWTRNMMRAGMIATLMSVGLPAAAPASVRSGIEAWQQGDPAKAVAIWRALAGKGDQDAAFNLGQAYRLGRGVPADRGEARKWFEKAARAGHLDAQVSLGLLLFDTGDRTTALMWLKRAADRGEPRALLVTGTALFNGDGMTRDPVLGYAFVSRAAAQGLAPATATLAAMDKVMPVEQRRKAAALALTMARTTAAPVAPAVSGGWRIQLGAFATRGAAQALFATLRPALGGAQAYYLPVGTVTRLQAGPYPSRAEAARACARLNPQPCFAVAAK